MVEHHAFSMIVAGSIPVIGTGRCVTPQTTDQGTRVCAPPLEQTRVPRTKLHPRLDVDEAGLFIYGPFIWRDRQIASRVASAKIDPPSEGRIGR